jgi:hypothetical protein
MPYKDPKKESDYQRQYRLDNVEICRDNSRRYKARRRDRVKEAGVLYRETHHEEIMFAAARRRSTKSGMDFSIDLSDIYIPEVCPILGTPIFRNTGGKGWNDNSPTLDRIDSDKGYVKGNIWVISWRANTLKRNGTLEEHEKIDMVVSDILMNGGLRYPSISHVWRKKGEGKDPRSNILRNTKAHAKQAGLEFNIEHSDIVIPEVCPILGIPLFKAGGKATPNSPSIDRIDPSKGYIKGNVWIISWHANRIKNNATSEERKLLTSGIRKKLDELATFRAA